MKELNFNCDIPGVPQSFINTHPYDTNDILSCRQLEPPFYEIKMKDGKVLIYDDILEGTRQAISGYSIEESEKAWIRETGIRLGYILRARQISGKDLSEATGISAQSISGYIHGTSSIPAFRLLKICRVLGISMDYFTDSIDI
mgnify:CR=1 FL=1